MARWDEFEAEAPQLAVTVRARLDAGVHKTIATLRKDGSPRISGIETFWAGGDLWTGSMPRARKATDLQRDPRFALHSASTDPPEWDGDAKLSGVAEELTDPERRLELFRTRGSDPPSPESHLFRLELLEVATVGLSEGGDRLVVRHWAPGRGVTTIERE